MKPESTPVQAATFQLDRTGLYVMNLIAIDMGKVYFEDLTPVEALEALSSWLFRKVPDNGIELRPSATGVHRQVIAEGCVGNESAQPDAVVTFLGTMVTRRFVVEIVRDQTPWDKLRHHHKILHSYPFGQPAPIPRSRRRLSA